MREIKFRAWDSTLLKMLYGVEKTYDTLYKYKDAYGKEIDQSDTSFWSCRSFGHILRDSPELVMQFTGLLDKNGKEIYEGDIVRYGEIIVSTNEKQKEIQGADAVQIDGIGKVYWDTVGADFSIELENTVRGFGSRGTQEIEVIGTIHENPDLLNP